MIDPLFPQPPSSRWEEGGFDPDLVGYLRGDFGEESERVVAEAMATAHRLAEGWGVEIDGWLPGATCSLVLSGTKDGRETVLRIPLLQWETEVSLPVMLALSEHGGVPILLSDPLSGGVLMPRLRPGTTLIDESEEVAFEACVEVMLRLREASGQAPSVEAYLAESFERLAPEGLDLKTDVCSLRDRLLETSPPPRLLHGDLHHGNVVRDGETWVALDPEGLMGDGAYECAAFLRNPVYSLPEEEALVALLRRRIYRFAERLGDPPERIWGWATVRTAQTVWNGFSAFTNTWIRVVRALDLLGDEFDTLS